MESIEELETRSTVSRFETLMIMLSVFISSIVFFKSPFEGYFHYIVFALLLPFFMLRYGPPVFLLIPFGVLTVVGLIHIVAGNDTAFQFVKIFVGMLLSVSFYYYVLRHFKFDTVRLFKLYLKGSFIAAMIGVMQLVAFRLHITRLYDFHWIFNKWGLAFGSIGGIRVNSIFSEPSQCAIVLAPAAMVAAYEILLRRHNLLKRYQAYIILFVEFFTFSSVGYIGFFLIFLLLAINFGRISMFLLVIVFGILVAVGLYQIVPEFQLRVDSTIALWVHQDYAVENVNTSSFVLYNNFHVAWESFKTNFLVGTGLGSHPVAFERYSLTAGGDFLGFSFNQSDGNSLFIRLMSETGLLGLVFMFVLIRRHFVRRRQGDNQYWLISSSLLIIIILYLFRQGNYFVNGFPFFVWMYYYNSKVYREQQLLKEEQGEELQQDSPITG